MGETIIDTAVTLRCVPYLFFRKTLPHLAARLQWVRHRRPDSAPYERYPAGESGKR